MPRVQVEFSKSPYSKDVVEKVSLFNGEIDVFLGSGLVGEKIRVFKVLKIPFFPMVVEAEEG